MNNQELADKLDDLAERYRAEWRVEQEPHNYPDGTKHFNHVRYTSEDGLTVEVASYVTPELGELLCLLHNNLDKLTHGLRMS
jgi:hypothetical protein